MPNVTVLGVANSIVTVPIASVDNAAIAQQLANAVSSGITAGTLTPYAYPGYGPLNPPTGAGGVLLRAR